MSEEAISAAFARREFEDRVVWLRLPDADLGDQCVLCSQPAAAAIEVPAARATGHQLELPLCRKCEWEAGRSRRWAVWLALAGVFMVAPVGMLVVLWASGLDLRSHQSALRVPFWGLFLAPFVGAACFAVRGRRVRGVEVVDIRPRSEALALRFDSEETAQRIHQLNWPAG